jgi:uncharacterized protein (TIGR02271 family)
VTSNTRDRTTALPLVEEEASVAKREVVTGGVRIRTVTDTKQEFVQEELHGEDIEVRRIPIDRYVEDGAAAPQVRTVRAVTIVPIVEEILVVEKRLLLKEEVHFRRRATTETTNVAVMVRKQRAVIERLNSEGDNITEPKEKE